MAARIWLFAAALTAFLLAGCASVPTRVEANASASLKRVLVVSIAAAQLQRRYTGLTVLGNEHEVKDITAWGLDDEFETQIMGALKERGIVGMTLPGTRAQLLAVNNPNGPRKAPAFSTPNWKDIESTLRALGTEHKVDGFVLITPREVPDFLAGTNQFFAGLGFYARGFGSRTTVSVLHLIATVSIGDSSGKLLASRPLLSAGASSHVQGRTPLRLVDAELARRAFNETSESAFQNTRGMLVDLPRHFWAITLDDLIDAGKSR